MSDRETADRREPFLPFAPPNEKSNMKTSPLTPSSQNRTSMEFIRRHRSASASLLSLGAAAVCLLPETAQAQNAYLQRNLVSDLPGMADHLDPNLLNPWGIAFSATGPF